MPHAVAQSPVRRGSGPGTTHPATTRATDPAVSTPNAEYGAATIARPSRVAVPSVDINSDLVDLELAVDGTLETPEDFDRAGWYVGSPRPGATGPAIIAGHVDSIAGPAVFHRLRHVQAGDRIDIGRVDGTTATFVVTRIERHPKDDFPTQAVYGDVDHAALRLITCGGTFDDASGHYRDNVIVFAQFTDP